MIKSCILKCIKFIVNLYYSMLTPFARWATLNKNMKKKTSSKNCHTLRNKYTIFIYRINEVNEWIEILKSCVRICMN